MQPLSGRRGLNTGCDDADVIWFGLVVAAPHSQENWKDSVNSDPSDICSCVTASADRGGVYLNSLTTQDPPPPGGGLFSLTTWPWATPGPRDRSPSFVL